MGFSFLIVSNTAKPDDFKPREIVSKGRLDVIGRFILSSFEGNSLKKPDKIITALLGDQEKPIIYYIPRNLSPSMITEPLIAKKLAQIIRKEIFVQYEHVTSKTWAYIKANYIVVLLTENGKPFSLLKKEINNAMNKKEVLFVFGAQKDVPKDILNILKPVYSVSLGKTSYLASQASTIIRYLLTL